MKFQLTNLKSVINTNNSDGIQTILYIIFVLGCIYSLKIIIYFALAFINFFMRLCQQSLSKKYGKNSWAVITGASDGIGKGFCFELASERFNIVLVGRNLKKLQDVEQELIQTFSSKSNSDNLNSIQTQIIVTDFKQCLDKPQDYYQNIVDQIKDKDISILVNNVGFDSLKPFEEISEQEMQDMVAVNVLPQAFLTKKLVNQLNSRKQKSAIITVSSLTAVRPQPFFNLYGATKAFNLFLSESLASEYSDKNIDFLCLEPGFRGFDTLSPRECSRGALNHLGFESKTYGNWRHKFFGFLLENIHFVLPDCVFYFIQKKIVLKKEMERRAQAQKIH